MGFRLKHGPARVYFARNFLQHHVRVGNDGAKKAAELMFLQRKKDFSTVIWLKKWEFEQLAGEVCRRQGEYAENPQGKYTTRERYELHTRGGTGADRKRATEKNAKFEYNVQKFGGDEHFRIVHYERSV